MNIIEFIEYLDEIVDYDMIVKEYNMTYSEIAEHIQILKNKASQQSNSGDTPIQCPRCGLREPMEHRCDNCSYEFNA